MRMHTLEHELFRDASGAWARLVSVIRTPGAPIGMFVAQSGRERGDLFFERMQHWTLVEEDTLDDRATHVSGGSADVLRGRRGLTRDELFEAHPFVTETRGTRLPSFPHLVRSLVA